MIQKEFKNIYIPTTTAIIKSTLGKIIILYNVPLKYFYLKYKNRRQANKES